MYTLPREAHIRKESRKALSTAGFGGFSPRIFIQCEDKKRFLGYL